MAKADRTNRAFKVVQCDQTSPFADSMMLRSEEVRRPLQRPVSFLLTSEVQHVNHIDRSFGAVFARWRGLGILSLPRLGRTRDAHLTHLDGVHEGSGLGDRPRTLFEFFQHNVGPSEVLSSLGFSGKPQISWTRMQFCTKLSNSTVSVTVLTRWRSNILLFQKHSSPSRETFETRQLCWKCSWRRKWGFPDRSQQTPDLAHRRLGSPSLWDCRLETSRGERHLEVNDELEARSRHSQGSLTF